MDNLDQSVKLIFSAKGIAKDGEKDKGHRAWSSSWKKLVMS